MSLSSWRAALRLARRDALRAKGRSLLVIAMIALPIVGVAGADVVARSASLTVEQHLDRQLGRAQASVASFLPGQAVIQTPDGSASENGDQPPPKQSGPGKAKPVDPATLLAAALPAGVRLIPEISTERQQTTAYGQLDVQINVLDLHDPAVQGLTTLLHGRLPVGADEAVATTRFLSDSGLSVGSTTSEVGGGGARLRIVGEIEYPDELSQSALVVNPAPGAPAGPSASGAAVFGDGGTYLVVTPGGAPFTWAQVLHANQYGFVVISRAVVLSPPPDSEVPLYRHQSPSDFGNGQSASVQAAAAVATVVGMALLEIVLLAGPAFAVGARRSRRQLGLIGAGGGSPADIRRVVLGGGIVLGGAGAAIGLLLGTATVALARGWLEQHAGQRFGGLRLEPLDLAGIVLIGIVTGLLSALVPAVQAGRQEIVSSLTGRGSIKPPSRRLLAVGLVAVIGGTALAMLGAASIDGTDLITGGSIIAELGVVACTPFLVGLFGRLGRLLPLGPRLALRDATRNRGRTAPAVAAVMAAVAGAVAVLVYTTSSDALSRSTYTPSLPSGGVELLNWSPQSQASLDRQASAVESAMPGLGARAGEWSVAYGHFCDGPSVNSCGTVDISLPPAQRCPDSDGGAQSRTPADPRCLPGAAPSGPYRTLVAGDAASLRALTGSSDPAAARALAEGKVVVTDPRYLDHGMATLTVSVQSMEASGPPTERDVRLPGFAVKAPVPGVPALLPLAAARSAGLLVRQNGVLWSPDHVPSSAQQQRAKALLGATGQNAQLTVERGFEAPHSALVLGLLAAATVVAVAAAGIATGLAAADSQADLATLAAVGARPGLRRRLSGFQCAVVAAMGALLGIGTGLVPAAAVWKNRFAGAFQEASATGPSGLPIARPSSAPLVLPWGTLALLVIGLPTLAWVLAALSTRSRVLLARRAG